MVTAAQAAQVRGDYRDQGYAIVRGFLAGDELAALRAETDRIYAEGLKHHATYRDGNLRFEILPESRFGQRYVTQAHWMGWISPYFEALRRSDAMYRLLEPLLGSDIKQMAQQIHWKPPGAELTGYRFHQDLRFRPGEEHDAQAGSTVTVGLAIDPATEENGCLRVVPGSHKRGYLGLSDEGDGALMKGQTAESELQSVGIDPAEIVAVALEPGDLVIWGLLTVHGSAANRSQRDRAFLLSSYIRAEAGERGEWAFKDGVSTPLGDAPRLCKDDRLLTEPGPVYDTAAWWA